MATRVIHQLIDDLTGDALEGASGETVRFSLDGVAYEIDLSSAHAEELRELLRSYIAAGRRSGSTRPAAPRRTARAADAGTAGAVREWAKSQGIEVSARGRIPQPVMQAYEQRG